VEELGQFAFEGVANELKGPSYEKKSGGVEPEAMKEDGGDENGKREQDGGDAEGMTEAIDGMLMAGGVLGDPLVAGASG